MKLFETASVLTVIINTKLTSLLSYYILCAACNFAFQILIYNRHVDMQLIPYAYFAISINNRNSFMFIPYTLLLECMFAHTKS